MAQHPTAVGITYLTIPFPVNVDTPTPYSIQSDNPDLIKRWTEACENLLDLNRQVEKNSTLVQTETRGYMTPTSAPTVRSFA